LHQDTGDIFLNDQCINQTPSERRRIGLVYQDYALFPHLTVRGNIAFSLRLQKKSQEQQEQFVTEISQQLQISHLLDRRISTLSGGEQQRVALARSLVFKPEILLLDEPVSSLDMHLATQVRRELKHLQKTLGTTFVHVTHNFDEAVFLADRVAVMNNGRIEQIGRPEEIFHCPRNHFVAEFVGIKNIYHGICTLNQNALKEFVNNGLRLIVDTPLEGKCHCSILPEDILVSTEKLSSSARNSLSGTITAIAPHGRFQEIVVDVGLSMTALITRQSLREMNIEIGQSVWLTIKTSAVNVF